jgi:transcriptional regulator with PAS, ATPase and Fis domain
MTSILVETLKRGPEDSGTGEGADGSVKEPGIVLIFAGREPMLNALPLRGDVTELGRITPELQRELSRDPLLSRRHAQVSPKGSSVLVTDLSSRNGTRVDGEPLPAGTGRLVQRYFRIGDSLFTVVPDVRPFRERGIAIKEVGAEAEKRKETGVHSAHTLGPVMQGVIASIRAAARHGDVLHITGESGVGKELCARAFHEAWAPERSEVLAVGASRPRSVKLHVCSATHQDLRAQVAAGRLREDLYFRIAKPAVAVPPLRERIEEIPWLVHRAARQLAPELQVSAAFVEACLGRAWPGNIRELHIEVRSAVQAALEGSSRTLEARHLSPSAGVSFAAPAPPPSQPAAGVSDRGQPERAQPERAQPDRAQPDRAQPDRAQPDRAQPDRAQIERALAESQGNVSAAARLLGVHRTQLYRYMARYKLEPGM